MQVIATAGHVDHGKSALVRALTGMEPDRWAEERRRGLTIDLGFAWMKLPGGERLAFVDVPGHERFVPNMLAGVGPVPAVLFVVAADGGWMPQSAEHLAAIDAVGIRHGLLAVTRSDLADPGPATRQAAGHDRRHQPGRRPGGGGERGDRRRAARTAGGAGRPGRLAARPRPRGAGPALGGPVVQHQGQRHGRHRHAARRDRPHRTGTAAHPVHAPGQDPRHRVTERARPGGPRRGPGRPQPARPARGHPGSGDGPGGRRALDDDQARRRQAVAPRPAPAAARRDPAHRVGPDAGAHPAAGPRGPRDRPAHAPRPAAAARGGPRPAPRPGQRGRGDPGRHRARRGAARAGAARSRRRSRPRARGLARTAQPPTTCCDGTGC